jgi:hypothetical protein
VSSRAKYVKNGAVNCAVTHAMQIGHHGVLVTQHSHTFYTVVLSKEVPFGQPKNSGSQNRFDGVFN